MGACCCVPAPIKWQRKLDALVRAAAREWASPCLTKYKKMDEHWRVLAYHMHAYVLATEPFASTAALCELVHATLVSPHSRTHSFAGGLLLMLYVAGNAFSCHASNAALLEAVAARALVVFARASMPAAHCELFLLVLRVFPRQCKTHFLFLQRVASSSSTRASFRVLANSLLNSSVNC
jgi:DNA-binding transcriptional LysR family regulator